MNTAVTVSSPTLWHSLSVEDAYKVANSSPQGLTKPEAAARLAKVGRNELAPQKARTLLAMIWEQLANIITVVLVCSTVISLIFQEWVEAGFILLVVVLNVVIGVGQEGKAERATQAIKGMLSASAIALRNGKRTKVDAGELVPGDVIFLAAGDRIPADVRFTDVSGQTQVTEAMLTGESAPVVKETEPSEPEVRAGGGACWGDSTRTAASLHEPRPASATGRAWASLARSSSRARRRRSSSRRGRAPRSGRSRASSATSSRSRRRCSSRSSTSGARWVGGRGRARSWGRRPDRASGVAGVVPVHPHRDRDLLHRVEGARPHAL